MKPSGNQQDSSILGLGASCWNPTGTLHIEARWGPSQWKPTGNLIGVQSRNLFLECCGECTGDAMGKP
eukprot:685794-Pyramimonas_sp.AAC.1